MDIYVCICMSIYGKQEIHSFSSNQFMNIKNSYKTYEWENALYSNLHIYYFLLLLLLLSVLFLVFLL